jgi:hypothetical protein
MSGTLRGTLYYTSEQVSSHLHRRFSVEMAENTRCRLSASVYVNAIDESEMINPVDQSGGFGGFRGCVLARVVNISPPEEGVFFFGGGGWQTRQTRKPGVAVWMAVGETPYTGFQSTRRCLECLGLQHSPGFTRLWQDHAVGTHASLLSSSLDQPCSHVSVTSHFL